MKKKRNLKASETSEKECKVRVDSTRYDEPLDEKQENIFSMALGNKAKKEKKEKKGDYHINIEQEIPGPCVD